MSSWGLLGELWCSRARSVDLGVYTLIISLGTARWLSRVAYLCSLAHSARGLPLPPLLLTLGVLSHCIFVGLIFVKWYAAAAAKSLQSCLTLCNPIDGSPPGSPVPGILQASTLEWVAISFSNAGKWNWSCSVVSDSLWPHGLQPTRLLRLWDFPGKSTGVGCHCLLR